MAQTVGSDELRVRPELGESLAVADADLAVGAVMHDQETLVARGREVGEAECVERDARVIGEAITPVMRLLVALTYAKFPESVNKEVLTDHGRAALRQPPLRNEKKRLSIASVGAWKVCSDDMLSFTATYHDLFRKNPWTAHFLFKKVDGVWRFHDHAEIGAAAVCR